MSLSFSFPARVFLLFSRCCSLSDSLACSLAYLTGSGESFVVRHRRKGYSCPACRKGEDRSHSSVCELLAHFSLVHRPPSSTSNDALFDKNLTATANGTSSHFLDVAHEESSAEEGLVAGVKAGGGEGVASSSSSGLVPSR